MGGDAVVVEKEREAKDCGLDADSGLRSKFILTPVSDGLNYLIEYPLWKIDLQPLMAGCILLYSC